MAMLSKEELHSITNGIARIVDRWEGKSDSLTQEEISERRNHQNRTVKQLVGHMVDSASNNHQRMTRLQYNDVLEFPDYTQDNDRWIAIQNYQGFEWNNLVSLWKFCNLHIVHVIKNVDTSKLGNVWTDYEGNKVTLADMVAGYLSHLQLHTGEIEDILKK